MSSVYDCGDPEQRALGMKHATDAVRRGELVVLPTDTVYGVGADAFSAEAVAALLAAKGRGRATPPPVLVPDARTLDGLANEVPPSVRALVEEFWPGGLTVICWAQPSLHWDLGDTGGTVAVRMPDHDVALELLAATGPLAVSSANRTGQPSGTSADVAHEQLGDSVSAYLDAGPSPAGLASTIVDATGDVPRVVRVGTVTLEQLRAISPDVDGGPPTAPAPTPPEDGREDGGA